MATVVEGPVRDQLQWLSNAGDEVVEQFLAIAQEALVRPIDRKTFVTAGKRLGLATEQVEQTIEGLVYLMSCLAGGLIQDTTLSFNGKLKAAAEENKEKLREQISANSLQNPLNTSFVDLDWRLDVSVSSRSNAETITPKILLSVTTMTNGKPETHLLQCDYANFRHLYTALEQAQATCGSVLAKKTEKFLEHSRYV